jgi:hypothetical protein
MTGAIKFIIVCPVYVATNLRRNTSSTPTYTYKERMGKILTNIFETNYLT